MQALTLYLTMLTISLHAVHKSIIRQTMEIFTSISTFARSVHK